MHTINKIHVWLSLGRRYGAGKGTRIDTRYAVGKRRKKYTILHKYYFWNY